MERHKIRRGGRTSELLSGQAKLDFARIRCATGDDGTLVCLEKIIRCIRDENFITDDMGTPFMNFSTEGSQS